MKAYAWEEPFNATINKIRYVRGAPDGMVQLLIGERIQAHLYGQRFDDLNMEK